jgi:hypothetical protein
MKRLVVLVSAAAGLLGASAAWAGQPPGGAELFQQECGACHLAYPPQLLPARSWRALIDGLAQHFGENAAVEPAEARAILDYLLSNAADAPASTSRALRDLDSQATPLRITETPFWQHEHSIIPAADWRQVKSRSNCLGCHNSIAGYTK